MDESNEAYLRAQSGFPIENVTCREGVELLEELTVLKELQVAAACLQETNKNWKQVGVYNEIKKVFSKVWRKNKLATSNSPECTSTAYQPGGTAS
eukprot:951607-Ditylum_brightwellii.AAC.1